MDDATPVSPLFPFTSRVPLAPRPAAPCGSSHGSGASVGVRRNLKPWQREGLVYNPYTSPYNEFCREQRPLLLAGIKNSDREKVLGHMWRELTQAERAAYKQGLTKLKNGGRGGLRAWARAHDNRSWLGTTPAQPGPVAATSLHCQPRAPVTATVIFPSAARPAVAATAAAARAARAETTAAETAAQTAARWSSSTRSKWHLCRLSDPAWLLTGRAPTARA